MALVDDSALTLQVARVILDGFDKHYRLFRETSEAAHQRFESADWAGAREANRARIQLYDDRVRECVTRLYSDFAHVQESGAPWPAIKLAYISLLHQHWQPECAETFFNSVACRLLHRRYYNNAYIFWRPSVATDYLEGNRPAVVSYYPEPDTEQRIGIRRSLLKIVSRYKFKAGWQNLRRDIRALELHFRAATGPRVKTMSNYQLQVLGSLFYRNKGAYIVGREINGTRRMPFVISLIHGESGGLVIDALLTEPVHIGALFSFARAYCMVDMDVPAAYVAFLHELLPDKPLSEIYTLLGLQKHGKTLFYRELHHHLKHSSDNLRISAGIRGMVMLVFTLPSFPYVFKVIRDRFDPPKTASREEVREKYQLVKNHDRVGRMADTLEFSNVAFPLERVEPDLLEELTSSAALNIEFENDHLIVKHVYIERRMQPLNTWLASAEGEPRISAIDDYGRAIRELAEAGIFPGDMMLKNFGMTRHGRIVFYDYDEIEYLTDCNFRRIPPCPDWMEDTSSEPWYSVKTGDVFPETFDAYFFSLPEDKALFRTQHGALLDPGYWREQQSRVADGEQADMYPYPASTRLHP